MLPDSEAGFKKGTGTMDNIHVLNFIVNKELQRKERKVLAFFVDFKAVFDSIDRNILQKALEEKGGVSRELRERLREVYEETICKVKVEGEIGEAFQTAKRVRQGCSVFHIDIRGLRQKIGKEKEGGSRDKRKPIVYFSIRRRPGFNSTGGERDEATGRRVQKV